MYTAIYNIVITIFIKDFTTSAMYAPQQHNITFG